MKMAPAYVMTVGCWLMILVHYVSRYRLHSLIINIIASTNTDGFQCFLDYLQSIFKVGWDYLI